MKRALAFMLFASLLFSAVGCTVSEAPSASLQQESGSLSFSVSQPDEPGGEYPPADTSVPELSSVSSVPESSSSQSAPSSSSSSSLASSSSSSSSSSSTPQTSSSSESSSSSEASVPQSSSSSEPEESSSSSQPSGGTQAIPSGEWRAVWFSYLDIYSWLSNKTKAQFTASVQNAFDNLANAGLNTVIVQVRPFGDALYASDIYPTSYLFDGTEGGPLPYDALEIMVEQAHSRGLELEAWVNPYRVRQNATRPMSSDNPAQQLLDAGSNAVFRYDGGVYYNPGSAKARQLIVDGIKEIVSGYDVDGVHMDDYFYGTTDASIDSDMYSAYKSSGGGLSLAAWRRDNVNTMVREVYSAVKAIDPSVRFGISPQGNNEANYDAQYADVATWCSTDGYIDYICPQIYWGFNHKLKPYSETLASFNKMIKTSSVKLYSGLAAYKIGTVDSPAGAGKNEWINSENILAAQVKDARGNSNYGGFALFRYEFCFNPSASLKSRIAAEMKALSALLD